MSRQFDYTRFSYLGDKVRAGKATKQEKDELMSMLHGIGKISDFQYQQYQSNKNVDDIIKAALAIGAVVLLIKILSEFSAD